MAFILPMPLPAHALALGVALAALIASAGCEAELYRDLGEVQADEVVIALDEAGIGAHRERLEGANDSGYRVVVARDDVSAALGVLHDQALPRQRAPGFAELFGDPGLIPSAAEERARLSSAVSGELSRSLESIGAITRARVHVALADGSNRPLDQSAARARASVLIEHRPGASVDEQAVRALVAGAVQDLLPEDVAVVLRPSETLAPRAREPRLAQVGPFTVSRASATVLKVVLGVSFGLNLGLALALILDRRRRTPHTTTRREPGPTMEE